MDEVFLLWHVHELGDGESDDKLIGVYRHRFCRRQPTQLQIQNLPLTQTLQSVCGHDLHPQ
jgi:hypothetical protein